MTVLATALDLNGAVAPVANLIKQLTNYQHDDGTNTRGVGSRAVVQRLVGDP
jgi:hypothetical protein